MYRLAIFLISTALFGCGVAVPTVDPPEQGDEPHPFDPSPGSHKRAFPPLDVCVMAAPHLPSCNAAPRCEVDGDCAAYPGNYCEMESCSAGGCLSGRCTLTKLQGAECDRDAECSSGTCECSEPVGNCTCAPDYDGPHL